MLQTVTEEPWAALQSKAETNMTASTVINQIHATPAPNTKSLYRDGMHKDCHQGWRRWALLGCGAAKLGHTQGKKFWNILFGGIRKGPRGRKERKHSILLQDLVRMRDGPNWIWTVTRTDGLGLNNSLGLMHTASCIIWFSLYYLFNLAFHCILICLK